jgi:hypothetical protein
MDPFEKPAQVGSDTDAVCSTMLPFLQTVKLFSSALALADTNEKARIKDAIFFMLKKLQLRIYKKEIDSPELYQSFSLKLKAKGLGVGGWGFWFQAVTLWVTVKARGNL